MYYIKEGKVSRKMAKQQKFKVADFETTNPKTKRKKRTTTFIGEAEKNLLNDFSIGDFIPEVYS